MNKTWAAEAIRILWKYPPVTALLAIKDSDRRQFYAFHVRKLEVRYRKDERRLADQYSTLRDMEFPQLKSLDVVTLYEVAMDDVRLCVEYFLRPGLEEIYFMISDLDSKILHLLRRRCPELKKIAFHVDFFTGQALTPWLN